MGEEGKKYDSGKLRMDLLPANAVEQVAKVLTFGAKKYGDNNWKQVSQAKSRYTAAALRHMFSYLKGEKYDAESGMPHLAHAATCLLFILELEG